MVKSVIKEICIMLLLCLAIVLVLGVIFYESIPTNKVVPNKLSSYTTPQNVQSEIEESITQMNKVEISYEITESDLSLYRQTYSYTSGKPDPFSAGTTASSANTSGGTASSSGSGTTSSSGNTGNNAGGSSGSTGTFFNNTGHK